MTAPVPSASDSGTFRLGFFTSPAVNVMLFQASAENNDPVCATQIAANSPNAVAAVRPAETGSIFFGVQTSAPKLAEIAPEFQPRNNPVRIRPNSAPILVVVKMFWMILPYCR